jgi:hypothetical protein
VQDGGRRGLTNRAGAHDLQYHEQNSTFTTIKKSLRLSIRDPEFDFSVLFQQQTWRTLKLQPASRPSLLD